MCVVYVVHEPEWENKQCADNLIINKCYALRDMMAGLV